MSEHQAPSVESGQLINLALALITVVGGALLVSHRLTSSRPPPAAESTPALGEQNIDLRLWEDPLAVWGKLTPEVQKQRGSNGLAPLRTALQRGDGSLPLILAVMVSGQPYAEAREQRIRARFAVGAALGTSGYSPEEDHVGAVVTVWPTARELRTWLSNAGAEVKLCNQTNELNRCAAATDLQLRIPFEVYRQRTFHTAQQNPKHNRVVVLWVEEELFTDDPVARMALLIAEVGENYSYSFLGPRASSTLRAMLPGIRARTVAPDQAIQPVRANIANLLTNATLFLATPTAMDETLVAVGEAGVEPRDFEFPRLPVVKRLRAYGFAGVTNLACLDSQLASNALDELELRNVRLATNPKDHIVLISEWDTFYSRMGALAFGAELNRRKTGTAPLKWVDELTNNPEAWPANVHQFVYLRGMDGETAQRAPEAQTTPPTGTQTRPKTLEEIESWKPDANRPEGSAQFDYLWRIGERVAALDQSLWRTEGARVRAVGVIGSDVYDTLLVSRVLRPHLAEAVFFATDLDARYWQPAELPWSRNLVAISGYGLRLAPQLQQGVAPFRDANSTAVYAASLAALGGLRQVPNWIAPRRFEISRAGPIDLSTVADNNFHPAPLWADPEHRPRAVWAALAGGAVLVFLLLLVWLSPSLLRRLKDRHKWEIEPLLLSWEDVGGTRGGQLLCKALSYRAAKGDKLAHWLCPEPPPATAPAGEADRLQERSLLSDVIKRLNELILPQAGRSRWPEHVLSSKLFLPHEQEDLLAGAQDPEERIRLHPEAVALRRAAVSNLIERLQPDTTTPATNSALDACRSARLAAQYVGDHRAGRLPRVLGGLGLVLGLFCLLGFAAWRATFSPGGEPFGFSGVSVWPVEFIRLAIIALCFGTCLRLQSGLREITCEITRRYRLSWVCQRKNKAEKVWWTFPEQPLGVTAVKVTGLWEIFQQARRTRQRLLRVSAQVLLYLLAALLLFSIHGFPGAPLRGLSLHHPDRIVLIFSVLGFLFLTFWTIDSARLVAWFTRRLCSNSTVHEDATLEHFAHTWSIPVQNQSLLKEWIDLQLVADLTEKAGRLVYYPFVALFLMIVVRSSWWDRWGWPWPLVIILVLNLVLAAASSIMLQRCAHQARKQSISNMTSKLNDVRQKTVPEPEHLASQAEQILDEIKNLRRGAFAPATQSPLIGAILLNSSGAVIIQLGALLLA